MELNFSRDDYRIKTKVIVKDDATNEERERIFASMMLDNAYGIISNLIDSIDYKRNKELCNKAEEIKNELLNMWGEQYKDIDLDKIVNWEFM